MYSKERNGLTQAGAAENMVAVLASPYFGAYACDNLRFSSSLLHIELGNGFGETTQRLKISDISQFVIQLLRIERSRSNLSKVRIDLSPSDEMLKRMKFKLEEEDFPNLPLTMAIEGPARTNEDSYNFRVFNLGLKKSYFEEHGLNFRNAQRKVKKWYNELDSSLNPILPYKLKTTLCS